MAQTGNTGTARVMIPATGDVSEYVSIIKAAKIKGVTRSALYQAVGAGRLPLYSLMGKGVLRRADVEAYEPIRPDAKKGSRLKTWQTNSSGHETKTKK